MIIHTDSAESFKSLLRDTFFQFDAAELDFGIYRIMNHRRKEIENFIEKDLIQAVAKEFQIFKAQSSQELLAKIGEKKKEIEKLEKDLGEKILTNGQIEEKFKDRPFAKEYLELKKQLDEVEVTESEQAQVFNNLYIFFSRYYEDGDFISKRRYSSRDTRYAIPYNGEEVKLYWANFDQYYVKTGEVFKDYEFDSGGWRIVFRTAFADVEAGNVKGQRRYFLLAPSDAVNIDKESKACRIQFEYRQLTDEDLLEYKVTTKTGEEKKAAIQQDELNSILTNMVLGKIKEAELKAILLEKPNEKTVLAKHLYKYTHKITSDFFIHKNLQGFLERELDYFIKTEVLDIHNPDPRHFTRAKVVENIGKRVIEFLAGIEDYQKFLWEKKKFVLRTDYVITTDRISEEFLEEVLGCKTQLQEWADLRFGQINTKKDLNGKKLPVDTKHFDSGFKERLLEKLSEQGNLDDLIDGILIKSENWQALNLLLGKYKGKVQCIYIDPPFNTGTNEFLYKNNYLDSSWVAMMYDRLDFGRNLLEDGGSIFVRIDYHGNHYIRHLMDTIFGKENFGNEIVINRFRRQLGELTRFNVATDSLFYYTKSMNAFFTTVYRKRVCTFCGREMEPKWRPMSSPGLRYPPERVILGQKLLPPRGRHWTFTQKKIEVMEKENRIRLNADISYVDLEGKKVAGLPEYLQTEDVPSDSIWTDLRGYVFGSRFPTENPEELLHRVLEASSAQGEWVLDYFLGSGTTTAVAHKLGRKWIGIEMGDFFDSLPFRRMKRVLAGDKSGISKDANWRGGGFFKYHHLEQYEDTLHNIEFPNEGKGQILLKLFPDKASEYVMRYMLRHETEGSASLLDVKQFESPFEYKLRIVSDGKGEKIAPVDLVETFNYLLGLTAGRYRFLNENGRKYIIILGERRNRRVAVVWRLTKDIDLEKDRELIEKAFADFHPDEIFINGDASIKDYKVIESEFKALMGV